MKRRTFLGTTAALFAAQTLPNVALASNAPDLTQFPHDAVTAITESFLRIDEDPVILMSIAVNGDSSNLGSMQLRQTIISNLSKFPADAPITTYLNKENVAQAVALNKPAIDAKYAGSPYTAPSEDYLTSSAKELAEMLAPHCGEETTFGDVTSHLSDVQNYLIRRSAAQFTV